MSEQAVPTGATNGLAASSPTAIVCGDYAAADSLTGTRRPPHGRRRVPRLRLRRTEWALCGVVLVGSLAAAGDAALSLGNPGAGQAWVRVAIVGGLVGAGAFGCAVRGRERMGLLLLGSGLFAALWLMNGASDRFAFSVGALFSGLAPGVFAYLLLVYPTGRLRSDSERRFVAVLGCGASMLWLLAILTAAQPPMHSPFLRCAPHCPRSEFFTGVTLGAGTYVVRTLLVLAWVTMACATPLLIARRARSVSSPVKRSLPPIQLVAMANALCLFMYLVAYSARSDLAAPLGSTYVGLVLAIPFAMLLGLALERLFMGRALLAFLDQMARLPHADPQSLIAAALRDPSLQIAYERSGAGGSYVDLSGAPVAPPHSNARRAVTWIERDDHAIAAISYDSELADQEPFVHAAGAAAVMRLERLRLEADLKASTAEVAATRTRLKASTAELAASRTRLVEPAYTERRRIERDLHDSVQQDLVGLRIKLDMVAEAVKEDPNDGALMIASMGLQMDHVIEALRSLARGIYPSLLAERGLGEALKSAGRRCPAPVTVDARGIGRYDQDVEIAVYFCCLEALQNVAKHAGPDARASIRLRQERNDLIAEVRDTGKGFIPVAAVDNHGLQNMHDRIEAVGGVLIVDTLGQGTCIRAVIPTR
jgi:signal transduction histidine kinase